MKIEIADLGRTVLFVNNVPMFLKNPARLAKAIQLVLRTCQLGRDLHNRGHQVFEDTLAAELFPYSDVGDDVFQLRSEILAINQEIAEYVDEQDSIFVLNDGRYMLHPDIQVSAASLNFEAAFDEAIVDENYYRLKKWQRVLDLNFGDFMQMNHLLGNEPPFIDDRRKELQVMLRQAKRRIDIIQREINAGKSEDMLVAFYMGSLLRAEYERHFVVT